MVWDQDTLKSLIKKNLSDCRIILVAPHREPYMHIYRGGEIQTIMPASGVAIALDSLMQSCGGTWVAVGSGEADRETVRKRDALCGTSPGSQVVQTAPGVLTRQEEREYYYGFANSALWPLCHVGVQPPTL